MDDHVGEFAIPVSLIAELKEGDFSVVNAFVFEDFHDAWVWILEHKDLIVSITNPTLKRAHEIEEERTPERAERLIRFAEIILKED